jgi:hypothetical protein
VVVVSEPDIHGDAQADEQRDDDGGDPEHAAGILAAQDSGC